MRALTPEEIQNLEDFAELLFSDRALAVVMELDPDEFRIAMKMQNGLIFQAVTRARLKSEGAIREGIIKMAARGSTPAQTMAMDLLKGMKKDNT